MTQNTKMQKPQKTQTYVFLQNWEKPGMEILAFYAIAIEPIEL